MFFSIIIPSYKSENYIKDCLDSIEQQTYFINNDMYEVLIGVDSCEETLAAIEKFRTRYRNLRIFFAKTNNGPYVIRNSLVSLSRSDNLLFFDSDDIMLPWMIEVIEKNINNNNVIQFRYETYYFGENIIKFERNIPYARGVIFYKKELFEKYGGYQPWRVSADSEFFLRTKPDQTLHKINIPLFKRRVHSESLTQKKETNEFSELRVNNKVQTKKNIDTGLKKIERVETKLIEIV